MVAFLMILDSPLTELEIFEALQSFKPYKSPGPDGLHPVFYQQFWPQVKSSVIDFCNKVFHTKKDPGDFSLFDSESPKPFINVSI